MANKDDDKQKRLAEALRENLKRRKTQRREIKENPSDVDENQRVFREKSLKPDRQTDKAH